MSVESLHEKASSDGAYTTKRDYRTKDIDLSQPSGRTRTQVVLRLDGVDHTARPTWKLRETVEFYRDVLGLPLIHTISARGWGPPSHPDFLHFFFDAGKGSDNRILLLHRNRPAGEICARGSPLLCCDPSLHGAFLPRRNWRWKTTLEGRGLIVSPYTRHEILESIYFRDPNGYPIEITLRLRDVEVIDATDARLTLEAAIQVEDELRSEGGRLRDIDTRMATHGEARRRNDLGALTWLCCTCWMYRSSCRSWRTRGKCRECTISRSDKG